MIDGQQRVTTIILLLTALRDHITHRHWKGSDDGPTAPRLDAYFLKNVHEDGARRHKLVLRRRDQATLQALLDEVELPIEFSERVKANYDYFREKLKGSDPELVYRGIGRLVVVDVSLERGLDDAQLIFKSLNSTGVALSQSDLIRNFILMRLPEPAQTRLYDRYWSKVEQLFRGSESTFDAFIRDFLALSTKASKQERANEIYAAFRREFGTIGHDESSLEPFLAGMLRSAGYHAAFSTGSSAAPALRASLSRLRPSGRCSCDSRHAAVRVSPRSKDVD